MREQIESFAKEHGLMYLNTLEHEEIGIDLDTDTYDGDCISTYTVQKRSPDGWGPYLGTAWGLRITGATVS